MVSAHIIAPVLELILIAIKDQSSFFLWTFPEQILGPSVPFMSQSQKGLCYVIFFFNHNLIWCIPFSFIIFNVNKVCILLKLIRNYHTIYNWNLHLQDLVSAKVLIPVVIRITKEWVHLSHNFHNSLKESDSDKAYLRRKHFERISLVWNEIMCFICVGGKRACERVVVSGGGEI